MLGFGHHAQVLRAVVVPGVIDVVDLFAFPKRATDHPLSNDDVLQHPAAVRPWVARRV